MKYLTPGTIRRPFANYAHAVEVPAGMRLLVMSGQLGIGPDEKVADGAEAQTERCFANIAAILAEAGADMGALVRINAYVAGREHLAGYMAARDRFVADPAPASTLMIVTGFAREEFVVEVEALAALPPQAAGG
ncbi:RidA family protein [Acuticoccus sp. MNP-M23]|uniref:RidA family protein n=1 Tax=Acuticoccus sp. MNP-M23 TaxID=3072793 RepID=UPI0028154E86|nr:RidA family protein [Acuticoccus sp. MNP-M23]WMS42767.1 RidA family protein [Acuticoccus sp. MNP-M23]